MASLKEEEVMTVVSNTPESPDDEEEDSSTSRAEMTTTTSMMRTTTTTTTSSSVKHPCPLRSAGRICVCDTCEAARIRLLHRKRKTDQVDLDDANNNTNDDDDNNNKIVVARKVVAVPQRHTDKEDESSNQKLEIMKKACRTILECIGEDPQREGLLETPERWAKSLLYCCNGYGKSPESVATVFAENHNEMVIVKNIDIHSLCEHHMVPFTGVVHIGYIPNGKLLGLSKFARIAELYARRLQVQERLTRQIADAICEVLSPLGVAVVMECTHLCMVMRGVQKTSAVTTTSSVRGCFETNPKTRAEFFSIIGSFRKP
jgi:GTP cyclohydrolase I